MFKNTVEINVEQQFSNCYSRTPRSLRPFQGARKVKTFHNTETSFVFSLSTFASVAQKQWQVKLLEP